MDISLKITDRKGITHEVQVPTDMTLNLMQVIRGYELEPLGTVGICGGMAMCPTCQCYVLNDVVLPAKKELEEATLSRMQYVKPNSRLSCQVVITAEMEGLAVTLAPMM
jgi:ferredoxin